MVAVKGTRSRSQRRKSERACSKCTLRAGVVAPVLSGQHHASSPSPSIVGRFPLALAACQSAPGDYPSLAIRDVERVEGRYEPISGDPIDVPPTCPLDGPLDQRLAALLEQGRSAHARFTQAAPRASRPDASAPRARASAAMPGPPRKSRWPISIRSAAIRRSRLPISTCSTSRRAVQAEDHARSTPLERFSALIAEEDRDDAICERGCTNPVSLGCASCPVRTARHAPYLPPKSGRRWPRPGIPERARGQTLFAAGSDPGPAPRWFPEDRQPRCRWKRTYPALVHPAGFVGELFQPFAAS